MAAFCCFTTDVAISWHFIGMWGREAGRNAKYNNRQIMSFDPSAVLWPKCCHFTKAVSFDQRDVNWPKRCHLTKVISFDQTDVIWPNWCHLTSVIWPKWCRLANQEQLWFLEIHGRYVLSYAQIWPDKTAKFWNCTSLGLHKAWVNAQGSRWSAC